MNSVLGDKYQVVSKKPVNKEELLLFFLKMYLANMLRNVGKLSTNKQAQLRILEVQIGQSRYSTLSSAFDMGEEQFLPYYQVGL